ncbi:MAG: hypothetical protein JO266_21945 [Acidobacteria bacterium]|nr:hypothetical protein [Acidobacteriota bacterium]
MSVLNRVSGTGDSGEEGIKGRLSEPQLARRKDTIVVSENAKQRRGIERRSQADIA